MNLYAIRAIYLFEMARTQNVRQEVFQSVQHFPKRFRVRNGLTGR